VNTGTSIVTSKNIDTVMECIKAGRC